MPFLLPGPTVGDDRSTKSVRVARCRRIMSHRSHKRTVIGVLVAETHRHSFTSGSSALSLAET